MPYITTLSLTFHTKKLCSRLQAKCDFILKLTVLLFWAPPPLGGLRGNVRWSPLSSLQSASWTFYSVNWTFLPKCHGWDAIYTSEYRFKIGDFAPTGAGWPKISGSRGCPTNHSSSHKTRLKWSFVWYKKIWTELSPVLSQFARLTDWRTDVWTEFSSLDRVCIPCSAVKMTATKWRSNL